MAWRQIPLHNEGVLTLSDSSVSTPFLLQQSYTEKISLQTILHATPLSVNAVGGVFVLLFQVAWNSGGTVSELPAGMEPFDERLVTVTVLPICEKFPSHPNVTTWPFANGNCKVQPLIAVVPVLVIVTSDSNPPAHWLSTM